MVDVSTTELAQAPLLQDTLMAGLITAIGQYLSKEQVELVKEAYIFAANAHQGQFRLTGEDYICHPVAVALILSEMKMDVDCLVAAILHDVIEDTTTTKEELAIEFNQDVAELVSALSKLTQIDFKSREEAQAENMRKMFLAMAKDLRVIIIKLSDRLHNMRTISVMRPVSRRRIAKETLDIYAPIAQRLGMHAIRIELEDLSFKARHPVRRTVIRKGIKIARGNRKEVLETIRQVFINRFEESPFPAQIKGREKHLYSIYQKMKRLRISFDQIYDVYAFRIVVDTKDQCYQALGILHDVYKPIPGRFKDYIAIPKTNGYQSLHSVLVGPFGVPVEIQIRTVEMDQLAESGIAAHWLYKTEGLSNVAQTQAQEWLKNLLDMQKISDDSYEFIDNLKVDLFPQEIYVFTPKGRIVKLPVGSTAVDFAFAVHTDIGMSCAAAKIDRQMEPLHSVLRNGQTIEVIASDFAVCNPGWLNFVVTNKARNAIRSYLKDLKERDAIRLGGQLLNQQFLQEGTHLEDVPKEQVKDFLEEQQLASLDALLMDIGFGNRMPLLVVQRLLHSGDSEETALDLKEGAQSVAKLTIRGNEGMLINLANCCRPIPGDKIIGFFSQGRGTVVHRINCQNTREYKRNHKNWLNVQWGEEVEGEYSCDLRMELLDKKGVFAEIATILSRYHCNIENVQITNQTATSSSDVFTVTVHGRKHLASVMRRLRRLPELLKITRVRS